MILRRSFQARIASVVIALLLVVVGAVYVSVKAATTDAVRAQARSQLDVGARVFEGLLDMRGKRLSDAVQLLTSDFGFRDAVTSSDVATIRSVLLNHGARINAEDMFLLAMDGTVVASTVDQIAQGTRFRYDQALRNIKARKQSMLIVPMQGRPHLLVESTIMAPLPIGRVVMGFAMDDELAQQLRSLSGLDVSFLAIERGRPGALVSTQPDELSDSLSQLMEVTSGDQSRISIHRGHGFMSKTLEIGNANDNSGGQVIALLQSPLDKAMSAFLPLDRRIFWITVVALLGSLVGALVLARSFSQPVQALAHAAKRIGDGDYRTPVVMRRSDELGVLARAINTMQAGIAVREQQLAHNALHDTLTGLPSRALTMERLSSAIEAGRHVVLIYVGIENMRAVNDTIGLEAVDHLLLRTGQLLQNQMRPGDTVARLTANEFVLLVENVGTDGAVAMADRLLRELGEPQRVSNHDVSLDCCLGIAAYPDSGDSPDELLRRAAIARQDAASLPGRLQVYEEGRDVAHQRQISLIRDLRDAARKGELSLNYQPKLDLRSGDLHQAEALLRWNHPQFGNVSPAEFIPLAERTGSMRSLTHWVVDEAVRQLAEWRGKGVRVVLSVNVSADDLRTDDLARQVANLLTRHCICPGQLIFEITESAVMHEPEQALLVLNQLRESGIRLSVDDFGTGYSSLAQLKRLPVQELKIDQSFVRNLDETSEDAVIVRSTIEMSHNLGLKVVAEGVEYEHSLRLLERWQCDTAQGYLISRPLSAAAFEAWIAQADSSPGRMVH